ncbi:hypothetical protein Ancab_024282 [Ancistrocladus abbreviatus]
MGREGYKVSTSGIQAIGDERGSDVIYVVGVVGGSVVWPQPLIPDTESAPLSAAGFQHLFVPGRATVVEPAQHSPFAGDDTELVHRG